MGPLPSLVLEEQGERTLAALLRRHDLPSTIIDEPDARIPLVDMIELFDGAARVSGDPFLGLRIGSLMQTADYGPYLRFAAASRTLGGGIDRAIRGIRYYQTGGGLCLELRGDEACFSYCQHVTSAQLARQHADHVLPAVIAFVRGFLGDRWQPATYEVPYGRHGGAGQLEAMLRGAVAFDRGGVGVVFDRSLLAIRVTPWAPADAATMGELRHLVRGPPPDSLRAAVAHIVALRLHNAQADLGGTAARLRLRPRTLQRQLAVERTSYRAVLDQVRFGLACRLLTETNTAVGEIAYRLCYAEHSHFDRAFHRMAGCSPTQFRRAEQSVGTGGLISKLRAA